MIPQHSETDLTATLRQFLTVSSELVDADTVKEAGSRITRAVQATVPGCVACGVSVRDGEGFRTLAGSTEVRALDEHQYETGSGPCLDAVLHGTPRWLESTATDLEWPGFSARAREAGIGSVLALPLRAGSRNVGTLNLYSDEEGAFTGRARAIADLYAPHAAVTLANVEIHQETVAVANQLQEALVHRSVIEQAKGIVMARESTDADGAFQILIEQSQRRNVKLRVVAAEIVEALAS